jgi:hypothetical protein
MVMNAMTRSEVVPSMVVNAGNTFTSMYTVWGSLTQKRSFS